VQARGRGCLSRRQGEKLREKLVTLLVDKTATLERTAKVPRRGGIGIGSNNTTIGGIGEKPGQKKRQKEGYRGEKLWPKGISDGGGG